MNVATKDELDTGYYVLRLTSPAHNWFAGRAFFLPTDQVLTLGFSLDGQGTRGNTATVAKWSGLRTVMSYADPTRYASYETLIKDDQGRWHSTDIFRQGVQGDAGNGLVPSQSVVPDEVAPECLSSDGRSWSPWREIEQCEAVPTVNIFRVKARFTYPTATIAMRIPYMSNYLAQFIAKLNAAKYPGVSIDEIGSSSEGRPLWAIRLDDPNPRIAPDALRTIVVIAREHASEHASSWAAHGELVSLLRDTPEARRLRTGTTWIFIPIYDPDGGAHSTFDHLTDRFCKPNDPDLPKEIVAYARYFTNYVATGRTLDAVVSIHNVEANEAPNLICPEIHTGQITESIAVNQEVFQRAQTAGYLTGDAEKPWDIGMMTTRLSGWLSLRFGSLGLNYEVNDRYPARRLSLNELQQLGVPLAAGLGNWLASPTGISWHATRAQALRAHLRARDAYWQRMGYGPEKRTSADMLNRAY